MKRILILILAVSCCALAQEGGNVTFQTHMPGTAIAFGAMTGSTPVKGAPYSATMTNESVQTLADGTRIVQGSTGSTARDSQGRTRQDAPVPPIGNLSASDAPHLVIIQDPVAGASYTLNLTDKTAWKNPLPPGGLNTAATTISTSTVIVHGGTTEVADGPLPPPPPIPPVPGEMIVQKHFGREEAFDATTEDLGPQVMEGVQVTGSRTTRTIPAGKIGNDRPISIVTEVWTSPELKTVVLSKRNDPRTGEQSFKLTNIQRGEPDPSQFTVPSDFKMTEGAVRIFYKSMQKN